MLFNLKRYDDHHFFMDPEEKYVVDFILQSNNKIFFFSFQLESYMNAVHYEYNDVITRVFLSLSLTFFY